MNKHEVPQDKAKSFEGQRKALYAVNESGEYEITASSGWEAEEVVLDLAVAQYSLLTAASLQRVNEGISSPLEYHMHHRRMDITLLAQSAGHFKWQVRRHLKPTVFSRLSVVKQECYAEALGLSLTELQQVPAD